MRTTCTTIPTDDLATWVDEIEATFRLDGADFFDAESGGSDGWEWTECRLTLLRVNKLTLTREQTVQAFGYDFVHQIEADELTQAHEQSRLEAAE